MATERIALMDDDVEVISKLDDRPGAGNGLTPAALKEKFDEGPRLLKKNLNRVIEKLNAILTGEGQIIGGGDMGGNINMNGNRLYGLAEPKQEDDAARKADVDRLITWIPATLSTTWTESAPYTQRISIPKIPGNARAVTCWPDWSADAETRAAQREAWNAVSRIVPDAGYIDVFCDDERPVTAVPMRIEVTL